MSAEQAIAVTEAHRPLLEIDPEMSVSSAEREIVWTAAGDKIAWIVTLSSSLGFVRVHVEDTTGQVLEVVRSA
jgi:hypothetical protein